MQVENLREFIVVANLLNFHDAAEELHVSRSALSKHIAALEAELGFQLLERERRIALTRAGAAFYRCAQSVLNALDEGVERCRGIAQERPVRIMLSRPVGQSLVDALDGVRTPCVFVDPISNLSVFSALRTDLADMAPLYSLHDAAEMAEQAAAEGLEAVLLGEEGVVFLAQNTGPLAGIDTLSNDDLRKCEILLNYGPASDHVKALVAELLGPGTRFVQDASLRRWSDLIDIDFDRAVVAASAGIAREVLARRDDVVAFEELDGRRCSFSLGLAFDPGNANPAVRRLAQELRELTQGLEGGAGCEDAED